MDLVILHILGHQCLKLRLPPGLNFIKYLENSPVSCDVSSCQKPCLCNTVVKILLWFAFKLI